MQSVSCGPFQLTDYEPNEFYELSVNPDWRSDTYYGNPYSDVSLSSSEDFSTVFPFFRLRWDLIWSSDSTNYPPGFYYTILLDGEHYLSRTWYNSYSYYYNSDTISLNVNNPYLTQGIHNFTIIVETLYQGLDIDTVMVTVQISMYQITPVIGFAIPFGVIGIVMLSKKIVGPKLTSSDPEIT